MKTIILALLAVVFMSSFAAAVTYKHNCQIEVDGDVSRIFLGALPKYVNDTDDDTCTLIDEASSLKNSPVTCNVQIDGGLRVQCLDYNLTHRLINFTPTDEELLSRTRIPIQVKSNDDITTTYSSAFDFSTVKTFTSWIPAAYDDVIHFGETSTNISLNYTDIVLDWHILNRTVIDFLIIQRYEIQMKWDITDIPEGSTFLGATLELHNQTSFGGAGGYANITRVDNQTYTSMHPLNLHGLQILTNQSIEKYNCTGSVCRLNVTPQVKTDYDLGNNYASIRFNDVDFVPSPPYFSLTDGQTIRVGDFSGSIFTSKQGSTVINRPNLTILIETDLLNPNATLVSPPNNTIVVPLSSAASQYNLSCYVEDDVLIGDVWLFIDWEGWAKNDQQGVYRNINAQNKTINFTYNFSAWSYGKKIFDLSGQVSSNGRYITSNGTHWLIGSYGDDFTRVYDAYFIEVFNFSNPDAWNSDIDINGTNITMIDPIAKELYFLNLSGNKTSQCDTSTISPNNPFGVAFADNGSIAVSFQGATDQILFLDEDCNRLGGFNYTFNANPEDLTLSNDKLYIYESAFSPDRLQVVNATSYVSIENVTAIRSTLVNDTTSGSGGVYVDDNDKYGHSIYFSKASGGNQLTSIERPQESFINWSCQVSDTFGNVNVSNEWRLNFTYKTPPEPPKAACEIVNVTSNISLTADSYKCYNVITNQTVLNCQNFSILTLNSSSGYAVTFNSTNNSVVDSCYIDGFKNVIHNVEYNNTVLNSSFNKSGVNVSNGSLSVEYYAIINATGSEGEFIDQANITVNNSFGYNVSKITNMSGNSIHRLVEYVQNGTSKYFTNCSTSTPNLTCHSPYAANGSAGKYYASKLFSIPATLLVTLPFAAAEGGFQSTGQGLYYGFAVVLWLTFLVLAFTVKGLRGKTVQLFNLMQIVLGIYLSTILMEFSTMLALAVAVLALLSGFGLIWQDYAGG